MEYDIKRIRNFAIIAHIDHGKSTLADRILEVTNAVEKRLMKAQILDSLELERERGITIKLNAVSLTYEAKNGIEYNFNLIDTPGHVDFTYEVSRSLAACDGALLVIDATQGIQAQTLANAYLAIDNDLTIIPVINKIDLPSSDVEMVKTQIIEKLGIRDIEPILVSAKTGQNIDQVLEAIVEHVPCPKGKVSSPLKALVFDSLYDQYRGAIAQINVKEGKINVGDRIVFMGSKKQYEVLELGIYTPKMLPVDSLNCGEVGYVGCQIKSIQDVHVGDTLTHLDAPASESLPGYHTIKPMVFCGIYPIDTKKYESLKEALEKLRLNDASLHYEPESSTALGHGFRVGFLGLLHMEVIKERLEREYNLDLILSAPSVIYEVVLTDKSVIFLDNPSKLPSPQKIEMIKEPFVLAEISGPTEWIGPIMELCQERRGIYKNLVYLSHDRAQLEYEIPLSEIIYNFFDRLKSVTKGYATLDYHLLDNREQNLCKMDILLNANIVDALSFIVFKPAAYRRGAAMCTKLKEVISREQFEIPIQAAINNKIIARETVKALRKDVLAKCYGGDISRKKKLLEKQKEGKKRLKRVGSVELPQEAFMAVLSLDDE